MNTPVRPQNEPMREDRFQLRSVETMVDTATT